jgi:acetoin utilization deacetylase AcuC-like enzyme
MMLGAQVAGTVLTCELALHYGLACNLAGGTHHAHRHYGSG